MDGLDLKSLSQAIPDNQSPEVPILPVVRKQIFKQTPDNDFRGKETPDWARKLLLEPLLEGWRREVVARANHSDKKTIDIYYWSPEGKKLRSRPEVAEFLADNGITKFSPVFNFTFKRCVFGKEFMPYEITRTAGSVWRGRPSHEHSYACTSPTTKRRQNKIGSMKKYRTKLEHPTMEFPVILTGDDICPEKPELWTNQKTHARPVKKRKLSVPTAEIEDGEGIPDSQLYCVCKNVENGKMILCDNRECKIGWYHFECIGLSEDPEGSWYCPACRGPTSDVSECTEQ